MNSTLSTHDLVAILKAAGETTRLRILALLSGGEFNVKDLTRILGQSQPRVSRHLKLLAAAGLVERYQEGSWVFFRVRDDHAGQVIRGIIADALDVDDELLARDRQRAEAIRAERDAAAQAYFRDNAAEWDRIRALHVPEAVVTGAMREIMGPERLDLLVDLGTGTGHVLEVFAPQAKSAVGIDMNRQMLAYARTRMDRLGLSHVQLRQGDLFNVPLPEASADAVVLHQVLHFLDDPAPAIDEAARLLRPGGRLLIVDFASHDLEELRETFAHRRLGFSSEQMAKWLEDAGLVLADDRQLAADQAASGECLTVCLWGGVKFAAPAQAETAAPVTSQTSEEMTVELRE
ncbi:ArsR/SmtB family transcription factor [Dichotomicrobium thermohalophilum]|uniref:ArsR family transcriptional regulator n=1 Tax=Dichotomicrobium thermohalophilum TaxID=933063 RepID=A0A397QBH0_9HYPH|nr:metalloregulator ArsR/SmtB family transcription factor [Dichotomicrobium thermohalophilum]RIA55561.1 ArsR family transcriptional regulator [Dichotomicrobium thermohalophilum]